MNTIGRFTFFLFLATGIVTQGTVVPETNKLEAHFDQYSSSNETHHDNITDTEHSHTHKHSENEEEHEHHHEHNTSPQGSLKLLNIKSFSITNTSIQEDEQNYFVKLMISSEHPFSIFRPPIS